MQTYTGSCHCQEVKYTFESESITSWMSCNCSHCQRKWFLLHFIPVTAFTQVSWVENLTEYRFNTKTIAHQFCKTCWVQCFWKWTMPDGTTTVAINLNTLENIRIEDLQKEHYNWKDI